MDVKFWAVFFPEQSRRFLTFRWMALFVGVVFVFNLAMSFVITPARITSPHLVFWRVPMQSPAFLILYNAAVALGFTVIYLTRRHSRHYATRALFFGMLLGGVAGEMLYFVQLHWRT